MEKLKSGISVVVPVYNSASILPELVKRLSLVLPNLHDDFEVVLVNDGSRDKSWSVIEKLGAKFKWIRGICLMRNYGQHNALLAGIRKASYYYTITMDDDLQHPPEELIKLFSALNNKTDVVYGIPEIKPHGLLRNISSMITKLALQSVTGASNARLVSAWRIFRTEIRDAFADYSSPFVNIDVLLTWGSARFSSVKLRHAARFYGESNYTFANLIRHAANMMTGFSTFPLQVASLIGFMLTLFGIGILSYVVISYLIRGGGAPGFPFLASAIAIFSGAQLFALGVIGEYIARIHFRVMDKPSYSITKTTKY